MPIQVVSKNISDNNLYPLGTVNHILPVGSFFKHPTMDRFYRVELIVGSEKNVLLVCLAITNTPELEIYFKLL